MGLESATYIDQLVDTNPTGTDDKNQGDNHLRLIKSVLQNAFPNLGNAALTPTAAEINDLIDSNRGVPSGAIVIWSGLASAVPTGWSLCDGTGGTPDLASRFVFGTTFDAFLGATGGTTDITLPSSTDGHALTINEMPAHDHTFVSGSGTTGDNNAADSNNSESTQKTASRGGNASHDHDITYNGTNANMPPYMILAYIMKD